MPADRRNPPSRRQDRNWADSSDDDERPVASTSKLPALQTPPRVPRAGRSSFPNTGGFVKSPRSNKRPQRQRTVSDSSALPTAARHRVPSGTANDPIPIEVDEVARDIFADEPPPMDIADMPASEEEVRLQLTAILTRPNASRQSATGSNGLVTGFRDGVTLLPYQANALTWMEQKEKEKIQGIFADEMGLGKTRTMIALICSTRTRKVRAQTLIIVPASLVQHWDAEIAACTNTLNVLLYQGKDRHDARIQDYDVVIASYDIMQREHFDDSEPQPLSRHWSRIILDEAHAIRNPDSKRAEAAWELRSHFHWAITGTPVQNKILDLFSLFKFLRIGREFGMAITDRASFRMNIEHPLMDAGPGAQAAVKRIHSQVYEDTNQRLFPLEPKEVMTKTVDLSTSEREFYNIIEKRFGRAATILQHQQDQSDVYACAYVMILRLRQLCIHPQLVLKKELMIDAEEAEAAILDGDEEDEEDVKPRINFTKAPRCGLCSSRHLDRSQNFCRDCSPLVDVARETNIQDDASAKFNEVMDVLDEIKTRNREDKTIIYSTFVATLRLLESHLSKAGIEFVKYDGRMLQSERQNAMVALSTDPRVTVILVSLMAGGQGLNMVSCNNVILMDPWWNPAVEAQAFDRVHRIGQSKKVRVYKIVTRNTIEDQILALQKSKQQLADIALDQTSILATERMSMDQLFTLLRPLVIPSSQASAMEVDEP